MSKIELLLPAKDLSTGMTAINHGADAVYIGASAFGARQAAGNSLHDIEELMRYAHLYGSKVHVTVNTLLYDNELEGARKLLWELYNIGVDAVLIQDLGLLKLDIPPIALHASTQCHNHSVERIQFLEKLGALCVSYSGQCYISRMMTGRSGNRGECAQICRTRFDLQDANGKTLIRGKHLLSLKDMCRADYIEAMLKAGIVSFKVEGRLKNESYVKNVTAFYRQRLDAILEGHPECQRVGSGTTRFFFTPDLHKTFNREYTQYFIDGRREQIASFDTPKAIGEPIGALIQRNGKYYVEPQYSKTSSLSSPGRGKMLGSTIVNGDGLCFINTEGELEGFLVNGVEGNRIIPHKPLSVFTKVALYRNIDKNFEKVLSGKTAERKIAVDMRFEELSDGVRLTVVDEDGCTAFVEECLELVPAQQPEKMAETLRTALSKLGSTPFEVRNIVIPTCTVFLRAGLINELKTKVMDRLAAVRVEHFRPKDLPLCYYPETLFQHADYLCNITNEAHKSVYEEFGAKEIEYGFDKTEDYTGKIVMTCKYCLRHEMGWCSKKSSEKCPPQPLYLVSGRFKFRLIFDCSSCVMKLVAL